MAGKVVAPERIDIQDIEVRIVGDSPLVTRAWAEKAKEQMRGSQQKLGRQAKEAKDPEQEFLSGMHLTLKGEPGFPAVGIKLSAVRGGKSLGLKMTDLRSAFHVIGDILPIEADEPRMREDMVKVGMGVADMRYRPEFDPWSIVLPIRFNARAISAEQIVAMLDAGGFGVGIGEWRPERGGSFGMYHVEAV